MMDMILNSVDSTMYVIKTADLAEAVLPAFYFLRPPCLSLVESLEGRKTPQGQPEED